MKKIGFGVLSILVGVTVALAQDAPPPAQPGQNRPAGRSDPHIVAPRATPNVHPPSAPPLPYHFVTPPAPMPGQKFGNVSGVALTPEGHLLVFENGNNIRIVIYTNDDKGSYDPEMTSERLARIRSSIRCHEVKKPSQWK